MDLFLPINYKRIASLIAPAVVCVAMVLSALTPFALQVLRNPEISVALVGAKNTEQVLLNARYMQDFTEEELAEIETILDAAPEVGFQGETSAETLAKLEG
jgi:hypothetical protein